MKTIATGIPSVTSVAITGVMAPTRLASRFMLLVYARVRAAATAVGSAVPRQKREAAGSLPGGLSRSIR
jgi:hypothetical protein